MVLCALRPMYLRIAHAGPNSALVEQREVPLEVEVVLERGVGRVAEARLVAAAQLVVRRGRLARLARDAGGLAAPAEPVPATLWRRARAVAT